ncbi:MAG: serine hydrolase [bacterium]|nr:serine hydrolase [bacterium]
MKPKTALLLLGLILPLFIFPLWQREFSLQMFKALGGKEELVSPLARSHASPQILGEVTTLESRFDFGKMDENENILAKGAFVYDLRDGRAILEKNAFEPMSAASTIKIVTAAVALDKGKTDEKMTVNLFPTIVGESSQNLTVGEKFTLQELLYGLLLVSGNDTAETIAQGIAGDRQTFIDWMNDFAKKVGVRQTHFTTPSGLDEDNQYTTAYDLYLLGNYIFRRYPQLLTISATREKYLSENADHRSYLLKNKLLLWDAFPIVGGKAGEGEDKMLSLVALIEKGKNHRLLVSIIQTPSLKHDLSQILKLSQ